jgi:hypothetical protein
MENHRCPQTFFITLALCLCIASLVALPVGNINTGYSLELLENEQENDNRFEHDDSEDDFIIRVHGYMGGNFLSQDLRSKTLDLQNYFVSPVHPPPNCR